MFAALEVSIASLLSIFIIIAVFLNYGTSSENRPAFGIYRKRTATFWPKVAILCILLKLRKWRERKTGQAMRSDEIDRVQTLCSDKLAVDAVYFNAANKDGDHLITGMARRKHGLIDGFFYLKVNSSGLGVLQTPAVPDGALYQEEEIEEYSACGIKIIPVTPMKKWKIQYNGEMRRAEKRDEVVDVVVEAEWTSTTPYFHFNDMDDLARAKAIAAEPWSVEYFRSLERAHQNHYEQFGDIVGTARINGVVHHIHLNSVRDHTVGRRDWRLIHKYALHFLSAENGDRLTFGVLCMPTLFAGMPLGFIYSAKEGVQHPIQSCDLKLYQFSDKNPPKEYAFTARAGGRDYTVRIENTDISAFYISKDWETKIAEGFAKVEINGIKGWGGAEWGYRNIEGRSVDLGGS